MKTMQILKDIFQYKDMWTFVFAWFGAYGVCVTIRSIGQSLSRAKKSA